MKDIVDLKKVQLILTDDQILIVKYKSGFTIDESDAAEIDSMQVTICGGKEVNMIIDIFNVENTVTKGASDYFTKRGKMLPFTKSVAILQKGKQNNLESSFLSFFSKQLYQTKSFENIEDAKIWLKAQG